MFESLNTLSKGLNGTGYFIDSVMTQVIYLAARLQKPLLLEGPARIWQNAACPVCRQSKQYAH